MRKIEGKTQAWAQKQKQSMTIINALKRSRKLGHRTKRNRSYKDTFQKTRIYWKTYFVLVSLFKWEIYIFYGFITHFC